MAEYITVQNAIKTTWMILDGLGFHKRENGELAQSVEEVFATAPAADVKPVVRGKWIPKSADGSWRVDTCSSCKTDTHYVRYAPAYDFCPNCGADMQETKTQ